MKKQILFLLLSLLLLAGCGGRDYRINWDYQDGTLTIHDSSNGIIHRQEEWDEIADQIHTVVIEEGCYDIETGTFRNMSNLTTAVLHNQISSIGDGAFAGTSLRLDSLPQSLTHIGNSAFAHSSFELHQLPPNLKWIGRKAFAGCKVPQTLIIPEGISGLHYAFADSEGLREVYLPESMMELDPGTFSGCRELTTIHFPSKIQKLPSSYFENCTSLKSITLPMYIREIGQDAFAGCTALEEIIFPERLTRISYRAFLKCTALTQLTFPEGLTSIEDNAFQDCAGLSSIRFPESLTGIYTKAFQNCTGLTQLTLPTGLANLYTDAFDGCLNLSSFTVDESSTHYSSDENGFLYDSTGKELVMIPPKTDKKLRIAEGVERIRTHAFSISTAQEIIFPQSVTNLDHGALADSSVKVAYLPDSIQYIGYNLFMDCENLETIYYAGTIEQWNQIENIEHSNEHFSEYLVYDVPAPQNEDPHPE